MMSQFRNYFELPDAQDYNCRVQSISEDYTLVVEVFVTHTGGKRYKIEFQDVLVIKIPMLWKGASFVVGTETELLAVARTVNDNKPRKLTDKELASQYRLYKIYKLPTTNHVMSMYVLARQASIKEKINKRNRRSS